MLGHALRSHQRPSSFQALVNDVLKDFINHSVFMYLDNIQIFSKSLEEHKNHSCRPARPILLENQMFVSHFLGLLWSKVSFGLSRPRLRPWWNGRSPRLGSNWRFLGFANFYGRFIPDFSGIALPLTCLTSPKVSFQWFSAPQQDRELLAIKLTRESDWRGRNSPLITYHVHIGKLSW